MTKNEAFSAYPDVARFMNKEAYIEIESEEDRLELGEVFNAVGAYWDKGLSLIDFVPVRPPLIFSWDFFGKGAGLGWCRDAGFYFRKTPGVPILSWKEIKDPGSVFYWR